MLNSCGILLPGRLRSVFSYVNSPVDKIVGSPALVAVLFCTLEEITHVFPFHTSRLSPVLCESEELGNRFINRSRGEGS